MNVHIGSPILEVVMLFPADAPLLALERVGEQSTNLIAVAIFSGIEFLLLLAAIVFHSPGEWF